MKLTLSFLLVLLSFSLFADEPVESYFSFKVNPGFQSSDLYAFSEKNDTNRFSAAEDTISAADSTFLSDSINEVKFGRIAVIGSTYTAAIIGLHIWQNNNWWSDYRSEFHFRENIEHAQSMDKFAHGYASMLESFLFTRAIEWCGVKNSKAALWGSLLALLYQTQIEIQDGFARQWGFDVNDQIANTLGAGWFYARERILFLQNFDIKMSYYYSDYLQTKEGEEEYTKKNHGLKIFSYLMLDYGGQTYWFTANLNDLSPEYFQQFIPDFLNLAVGVSSHNLKMPKEQQREYYISLDYNFKKILPAQKRGWKGISQILDFFHFPAPAVKVSPDFKGFFIYYGQN